jgi:NADH-quinone oxidoreductase subunit N
MSLDLNLTSDLLRALLPELVLSAWGLVVLLVVAWRHRTPGDLRLAAGLTLAGLVTTALVTWWLWWQRTHVEDLAVPMIAVDDFRFVTDWLFLGAAALTVLLSQRYLEREQLAAPEYYPLILFGTIGMMLMGGASDLMVLFLGLELMSVAVYVLAAFDRRSPRAAEAGLKYFLIGAFASGFLLYGIALVFGATATTNLRLVGLQAETLRLASHPMLLTGLALLLVGFAFKVAAVPFHMWAPDVYDGAPTPVTGFMATAVKAAAFAALFRTLTEAFPDSLVARDIAALLAGATMIAGNLMALAQRSLKRMLAYSSIAHAGYLLVAVATGTIAGRAAFLVYLVAYTLMTLSAFAVLAAKGRGGESDVTIDDLAGLAAERPWHALALAVCMLSLLGFPGTAGFIGKWYILAAAAEAGRWLLAVLLVLTSVISAGYYLPVIMAAYMKPLPAAGAHGGVRMGRLAGAALAAAVVGLLYWGIQPGRLLELARQTSTSVRPATSATSAPAAPAVADR